MPSAGALGESGLAATAVLQGGGDVSVLRESIKLRKIHAALLAQYFGNDALVIGLIFGNIDERVELIAGGEIIDVYEGTGGIDQLIAEKKTAAYIGGSGAAEEICCDVSLIVFLPAGSGKDEALARFKGGGGNGKIV